MAVTINDVAKRAGVSHTTVSWVIHDDPRITPATKEKVLKAIKELNYHPNYVARSLVKGKTNIIAVMASFFSSNFELSILKGMEQAFDENNDQYNINLYSTRGRSEKKDSMLKEILYGKRADAVILLSMKPSDEMLGEFKKNNIPVVLVEEKADNTYIIKTDNERGAYLATEHLIEQGCRKIGLISGATGGEEMGLSPQERQRGYKNALETHGLKFDPDAVVEIEDYYFEDGVKAFDELIQKRPDLDAIFCSAGDIVAMGVVIQARKVGVVIPDQIRLIGYDNVDTSALITPPLTTVYQPIEELGHAAFNIALDAIKDKELEHSSSVFEPELVIRESSQPEK